MYVFWLFWAEETAGSMARNSYFQEVHPDPKTVLHNVHLFKDGSNAVSHGGQVARACDCWV